MKKYSIFILCVSLFFGNFTALAQQPADTAVHYAVNKKPYFPGHREAYLQFISTHLHYPKEAKEQGVSGKVYVSFVVEPDGSLSHLKVLKGIGHGCDAEVLRVFRLMPQWHPGLINGKPVRAYSTQVVAFRIKNLALLDNKIYTKVDSMPVFAVGKAGVEHFLTSQLWYPKRTVKHNKVDTIQVSFVVEKDGTITHLKLMPDKQHKDAYDYEALRAVSLLPVAHPAILGRNPVRARLFVPVVFNHKNVVLKGGEYKTVEYNFIQYTYFVPKGHLPVVLLPKNEDVKQMDEVPVSSGDTAGHIFMVVERMPEFPGGTPALMRYLATHIKYPEEAKASHCTGRIFLHFIVEKDGTLSHVKVMRGVCPSLDREALKVVSEMPQWIPGSQRGKPIRVAFYLPVKFSMDYETQYK